MEVYNYLVTTREGMFIVLIGGVILFAIIALVLEFRTRKKFHNHPRMAEPEDDTDYNTRPKKASGAGKAAGGTSAKATSGKTAEERSAEREQLKEDVQEKLAEGGIAGLFGLSFDDDDDDDEGE